VTLGVPLAVLASAAGPYDDPKVWALVILVAATALAWLVRTRQTLGTPPPALDRSGRILQWIVLAFIAWSAIATAASIAPWQSLQGGFGRGMGLVTIASAALLYFIARSECRTPSAVRALVDVMLLGSVPVCLLALGQAMHWDPLPKPWDPMLAPMTVRSTYGSHIFLGSYLVLLIPLTIARLEWAFRERSESGRWAATTRADWLQILAGAAWVIGAVALIGLAPRWPLCWWALVPWGIAGATDRVLRVDPRHRGGDAVMTAVLLTGLLAGQVLVVVLSLARGAFIAMLVGLAVTVFGVLIRRRARKTLAVAGLALLTTVAFLVLLNLPGSPVASLGEVGLLSRLSNIANLTRGSPGWVRVQVWKGLLDGWTRQLRGEEVIPGLGPRARSFIGYGPDTQLLVLDPMVAPFLGPLRARVEGARAQYVIDRAHNVLLEHLVTQGLVGAGLWVALVGAILVVGMHRIRGCSGAGEAAIRTGALGAVLAHVADGQVGIATPMALAVFWLAAAILTGASWAAAPVLSSAASQRTMPPRKRWVAAMAVAAVAAVVVGWASTRWLLASVAYADGTRQAMAGRMADAYRDLRRSVALAPGLPLPAEAAAYAALRLSGRETDPSRRLGFLHEAEATLAQVRRHSMSGSGAWALSGQIALAAARAGERDQLAVSRDAFDAALRLRPGDANLLAQSGWTWLEAGDAARARESARRALARDPREWLGWALLARSSRVLGDMPEAELAAAKARALAPDTAQRLLETVLP